MKDTETLHILVVDDELGMRLGVARALENFVARPRDMDCAVRFRVSQAETGEAALALLEGDPPDLILLDYKLPGISGIDVLEALSQANRDALVVMITAYASLETAVQATKLGAFDFLAKPFTPDELKAVVQKTTTHFMAQQRARELAREKRQIRFRFLSVLAHELKAPLSAVEGYLQILRDHTLGDQIGEYDRVVGRSLIRLEGMRKLIFDLLDLTRLESGQKQRHLAPVELNGLIARAIETVGPLADARQVSIACAPAEPVSMRADAGEIEIMLNNLLSNAVKYNKDGGRVDVRLEDQGDRVTIAVSDSGLGLSQEDLGRLFGEFARIRNERTEHIPGSGLGLSILRRLAHLYGGEVTVESQVDVGSTFTVVLPKSSDPAAAAADLPLQI